MRGVENGHQNLRLRLGLGAGDTAGREDSISAMEGRSEAISDGRLSLIRIRPELVDDGDVVSPRNGED